MQLLFLLQRVSGVLSSQSRTKGTGAQYLVKLLNIPHTSTVAIGDEQNDIPMIQSAHIGIAMKNGIDDIKKAADYVTENDNNHDAIAEVIVEVYFYKKREAYR